MRTRAQPLAPLRITALCAFLAATAYHGDAHAAPATRLVYSRGPGAEQCADEGALRRAVARRVGYDPFFPWGKITLIASVRRVASVYHTHIELIDARGLVLGTRDLSDAHADCGEMLSAMALGISIALDTINPRPPEPESPAPVAPSPSPPPPPPPPPPPAEEAPRATSLTEPDAAPAEPAWEPRASPRDSLDVGLGGVAVFGALPAPVLGAEAFLRYRLGRVSMAIEGWVDLPGTKRGRLGTDATAFALAGATVPCIHFAEVALCGLALFSTIRTTAPIAKDTSLVALGIRMATEIRVSEDWSARLHGDLVAPVAPVTLRVDGADLWTTPAVAARFGFGAAYRFW